MNKTKQKILETKRLTESVDYNRGYDIGSKHSETHYKQELKEQAERADDHFASILADLYSKIQELLKEFKK